MFLWSARRWQGLFLEPRASTIEMHMFVDLENISDWGGRNGQEPLCCVFKYAVALW